MFWQILVDPAISMHAAITEKISLIRSWTTRTSCRLHGQVGTPSMVCTSWTRLVRVTVCVYSWEVWNGRDLSKRQVPIQVERGRVILVPAHLSGSFSEEVECVDEERTDSEVRSVRSVERYDGWRFVTPSWWAVAKYPLCQISRWQLVQAMQEQIWRILVARLFALFANSWSEPQLECAVCGFGY